MELTRLLLALVTMKFLLRHFAAAEATLKQEGAVVLNL